MKFGKMMGLCVVLGMTLLSMSCAVAVQEARSVDQTNAKAHAKAEEVEEGGEAAGFKLSIKPEKKKYEIGDPVSLNVTFKDVSRENVKIIDYGIDLTYALEVIRPDGTLAPLTEKGKHARKMSHRYGSWGGGSRNPGDKQDILMAASAYFDMSQIGKYSLQVSREVPSLKDPKKMVTLYSNVVKITIAAPKAADDEDDAQD